MEKVVVVATISAEVAVVLAVGIAIEAEEIEAETDTGKETGEEEIGTEAGTGIKIEGAIARHLPMSQPDSGCPNVGSRILINHLPLL